MMIIAIGIILVIGGIVGIGLIRSQIDWPSTKKENPPATNTASDLNLKMEQQIEQILAKIDDITNKEKLDDTFNLIEASQGMIESDKGNPLMIVPLEQSVFNLGNIYSGSKQTFTGLTVDDSPFLFKIPTPGTNGIAIYSLAAIRVINNDRYELLLITQKNMPFPFNVSVGIEGQDNDLSLTTPLSKGFFRQTSEAPITDSTNNIPFKSRAIAVQVEWNFEFH
jgi:hypothetical protein